MKKNLYRGIRKDNGEWAFGYPFVGETSSYILYAKMSSGSGSMFFEFDGVEVFPETVGQYTGLHDATKWENLPEKEQQEFLRIHKKEDWNGKKIFEGDIVKADNGKHSSVSVVKFGEYYPKMFYAMLDMFNPGIPHLNANGFYAATTKHEDMILFKSRYFEVIGNIHDNPELLVERKEECNT